MSTHVSNRTGQFAYFDRELGHPDWSTATVLDFGGNVGNILLDPRCTIRPDRYWSLDVSRDAIDEGRRRHPLAHFVLYDRYNLEYNPTGVKDLPIPDLGRRFDIILAWSVFTHTGKAEMGRLVDRLRSMLAAGGVLAFTFLDPYFHPPDGWARDNEAPGADNLEWIYWKIMNAPEPAEGRGGRTRLTWATVINRTELVADPEDGPARRVDEHSRYVSFCTPEHMRSLYPEAEVLPPVPPERQHCCVLTAGGRRDN